jgi:TPP-dependent pyruvate/acetoin dehydrogenase alpha subunit
LLGEKELLKIYETMLRIRSFETKVAELFAAGKIPGLYHLSIGQEAIPAGACLALEKGDYLISHHRGHGHMIGVGLEMSKMFAELFGKEAGYNRGRGGSMHLADFERNILGANGIVGAGIVIATGSGLSAKLRKTKQITICFFGDGASQEGTFHEGLNLAAIWKLPVIFLCENNQYAFSYPARSGCPVGIASRAVAYGIPGVKVDGNDPLEVYNAVKDAAARARSGDGPTLIEAITYRWQGHWEGDPDHHKEIYRPRTEIQEWMAKDPIERFREKLMKMKLLSEETDGEIKKKIQVEVEEAVKFAEAAPYPDPKEMAKDVFATMVVELE